MSNMDRYRTREKANIARRVPLYDPATGEATEDWLDVRSSMSDAFKRARAEALQAASDIAMDPDVAGREEALARVQSRMHAALVADWSFDVPCTEENVAEFLHDSPHVTSLVVGIADRGALFFGNASASLSDGPKPKQS